MPVASRQTRAGRPPLVSRRHSLRCPAAELSMRVSWRACPGISYATENESALTSTPASIGLLIVSSRGMVLSGPPTLSPHQPTLWMQALGPRILHGFGEEGGGPI